MNSWQDERQYFRPRASSSFNKFRDFEFEDPILQSCLMIDSDRWQRQWYFKKFAIILLKPVWYTQRSERLNTRDHRGYTLRENTFSKSFTSHCEGISLVAGEGSNPSRKHIYNNKVILITFFILIMGFSKQEYWSCLPFPHPVDHLLSELFTITIPSWVALQSMAHSFTELCKHIYHDKAVIHEGWTPKNWCFRIVGLGRLFRVPWTARRSNQSILKETFPEYSVEGLMPKLKLQYFGHLTWRADSLEKTLMLGRIEGKRRRGRWRMRGLDCITDSIDMNFSKFWEIVMNRGAWCALVHQVAKSQTQLKNNIVNYPEGPLNKSSYRCSNGPEGGGLRPLETKIAFLGLWNRWSDVGGKLLLQF